MEEMPIATAVIKILKQSIRRIYIVLIITIFLFALSLIDSIVQRQKIENILKDVETINECSNN